MQRGSARGGSEAIYEQGREKRSHDEGRAEEEGPREQPRIIVSVANGYSASTSTIRAFCKEFVTVQHCVQKRRTTVNNYKCANCEQRRGIG